jgi:subfamily B ATP-binding cassette protein HlyB/CyaB
MEHGMLGEKYDPLEEAAGYEFNAPFVASSGPSDTVADSGLQCLLVIALLHGIPADEAQLRHEYGFERFSKNSILLAARRLGLTAKPIQLDPDRMDRLSLPGIARHVDGSYWVLAKCDASDPGSIRVLAQRPGDPPVTLTLGEFQSSWSRELILFVSRASFTEELARFDFRWFVPSLIKYRRLLGEILLISLALQVIGLATPIFFQVVMDKVLVNHAITTLDVIAIGLFGAIVFEALLGGIRSYVFSHTTSKLDVELGARLFRHLLALPISYFHVRRVGDSVARIRELENIRSFLTGNALTVVLDVLFSMIFFAVMFLYSIELTFIVLLSIPIYVALSIGFTPVLRARLNDKFNRGAENQSFLVESVGGIDTVKAMAIEPRWNQQWERTLTAYVLSGLSATLIGLMAGGAVKLVSKIVTLAIMWKGAWEVMDGNLTVGELVAFNMLSSQVASPILRLAQLWNDFQQTGVSMQRLGDILNTRTELQGHRTRLPRLRGAIRFEDVTFRYRADAPPALRNVTLDIGAGEIIGIVGRSGSGKSTVTKMIQRFYVPDSGRVLIDGCDLSMIDATSLRLQLGVVPQDGTLFNRSVRDNIALIDPGAALSAVIAAAQLAGAHEFICELPGGYDTIVGEHGTGISGGQRQRIAIARALLHDPRILIFDEATSALDYESERAIQGKMSSICRDRTVVIVAHRLSAVRDADRIVVMDRGRIAEIGSHEELIGYPAGIYSTLFHLQTTTVRTEREQ